MFPIIKLWAISGACAALITGCATVQTMRIITSVDSLAAPEAAVKKRYVLLPGGKGVEVGDLQFQEFAAYIEKSLNESGYVKAPNFQAAEIAIFLTYAIGDPQTYQYSYSLPTWGRTGVSAANTTGIVTSYGNTATYSGTTTYTPTFGITGYTTQVASETVYTRFLFLDAYDVATYLKENKMNQVWKTNVISTGPSNDLRLAMPYMVVAMRPYFGINTGRRVEVEVLENDPAVQRLRSTPNPG